MNTKKFISAIVFTIGSAGFASIPAIAAPIFADNNTDFIINPVIPVIPELEPIIDNPTVSNVKVENLHLYSFQPVVVNLEVSKSLISRFLGVKFTSPLKLPADKVFRYTSLKDVNTVFEHNLVTGDISFRRNFSNYLGDYKPDLPSTEEAQKLAQSFLEKNKLFPLNSTELKVAHIGGLRTTTMIDKDKTGDVVDKLITLTYSRVIDGIPVIGSGSKIIVDVGNQGEIIGVTKRWRELSKESRAITPTETYSLQDAQRLAQGQIIKEFGKGTEFKTVSSQIAYFDNNGKVLQPVYAFQTTISLPNKNTKPFDYLSVIPVLKKSPEQLNLNILDSAALRIIKSGNVKPIKSTGKPE